MRAGQHFLVDEDYIQRELDALSPTENESVLEIGSGDGRITRLIAERSERVIAIEKDPELMIVARERAPKNVQWVLGDALKVDFPEVDLVFSNVPYYISSPLLIKLVRWARFKRGVLALQKEFVSRVIAMPPSKDYGRISVMFNLTASARPLFDIPPEAFEPPPRVWSTVIDLVPKPVKPSEEDLRRVEGLTAALFSQKNRLLPKALCKLKLFHDQASAVREVGNDLAKKRVRELQPEEVLDLAHKIQTGPSI